MEPTKNERVVTYHQRRARLDRTSGRAMSPAPEATELRPHQKRRKTAKDAGVSTFHPWSDRKHGVVFLKKHITLGEDGTQVESKTEFMLGAGSGLADGRGQNRGATSKFGLRFN